MLSVARARFAAAARGRGHRPARGAGPAPPGPDRDQLTEALIGARVRRWTSRTRKDDPLAVTGRTRPDLLVIGTGPGEGDPSAVASTWTSRRSTRPRAVVLIETLRAVDRLRAVAAGVDAVFQADRMVEDLPRYARTLARIGAPPSTVLLLDERRRARHAASRAVLEEANIRVVRSPLAKAVQELLDREVPDLLAGGDPAGRQRTDSRSCGWSGRIARFHLLPVVVIGAAGHGPTRSRRFGPAPTTSWPTRRRRSCCSRPSSPAPSGAGGCGRCCTATS